MAALALAAACTLLGAASRRPPILEVVYDGYEGPGKGKHIVLVSGDEEYRSEEAVVAAGQDPRQAPTAFNVPCCCRRSGHPARSTQTTQTSAWRRHQDGRPDDLFSRSRSCRTSR